MCPEFNKVSFFPPRFGRAVKNGEKGGGIGSGGSPTDQQPESHQQPGIQLVS